LRGAAAQLVGLLTTYPESALRERREATVTAEGEGVRPATLRDPEKEQVESVVPPDKPARMTVEQANRKAMLVARRMKKAFFLLSAREQARQIGCHWQTWTKTTFYAKAQVGKARLTQPPRKDIGSPPVASLTGGLEAVAGEGDRDEVLKQLIAEQEADLEPSPLDADPPDCLRKRCAIGSDSECPA
jgi:hypothetical protein